MYTHDINRDVVLALAMVAISIMPLSVSVNFLSQVRDLIVRRMNKFAFFLLGVNELQVTLAFTNWSLSERT
jgi:hypothetical protein